MVNYETILNIYKGKKIFLTGHTGFKGSWFLSILNSLGAIVKGYALEPNTAKDLYHKIEGDNLCTSIIADIRNYETLNTEIQNFQPDYIFHLAAQPLVIQSYKKPIETFEINAIGTANLLESIKGLEKKCTIVLITTDKVYHNNEWQYPYRETDNLGGYDPYSASKACAEIIIDSYRNSFFNLKNFSTHQKAIAVARAGNVIGGGDYSQNRIIPDIVNAIENDEDIKIRNPYAIRPWQHVLEPLLGYLILGAKANENPIKFSTAYNFGPFAQDTFTVKELVEKAISILGKGNLKEEIIEGQLHEAGLLKLDINKAINELGWTPKLKAEKSIEWTLNWYKQPTEIQAEYTKQQIIEYFSL